MLSARPGEIESQLPGDCEREREMVISELRALACRGEEDTQESR